MIEHLLAQFSGWLSSKTVPWFAPYWEAKKLHEGSPHGLFPRTFYAALSAQEIQEADRCPRLARAITLYEECIVRERRAGRHLNEGVALHQLGLVLHRQGKLVAARQAYEQAIGILEDLPNAGALPAMSACQFRLAEICMMNGDKRAARMHLERSRSIYESLNDRSGLAGCTELGRKLERDVDESAS